MPERDIESLHERDEMGAGGGQEILPAAAVLFVFGNHPALCFVTYESYEYSGGGML